MQLSKEKRVEQVHARGTGGHAAYCGVIEAAEAIMSEETHAQSIIAALEYASRGGSDVHGVMDHISKFYNQ